MTTSAGFLDQAAGRSRTPAGTTPSRARRQSAISSLRARATINVLRVDGASAVRCRYHWASALSFWNRRNRQANWIIPCRTRALPERANPFSRRFDPDANHTGQQQHHDIRSLRRRLHQVLQPRLLKLADLFLYNLVALQIALERGQ